MNMASCRLGLLLVGSYTVAVEAKSAVQVHGVTKTSLQAQCGEVSNDVNAFKNKLDVSRVKLGLGNAAVIDKQNQHCSKLDFGACVHGGCTWCGDSNAIQTNTVWVGPDQGWPVGPNVIGQWTFLTPGKCYALQYLDNPCFKESMDLLIWGKENDNIHGWGKQIAQDFADSGSKAVRAHLLSGYTGCTQMPDLTSCFHQQGFLCNWCNATTSCHSKGSPNDACLKTRLKNIALTRTGKPVSEAVQKTQNAYNAQVQDQITLCNSTTVPGDCQSSVSCLWCSTAYNNNVNQCYFIGDASNPCFSDAVVDEAGNARDAALWVKDEAGAKFQDMNKWGNDICDKYPSDSFCDAAVQCQWCANNTNCYIYGSINNPCGVGGALVRAESKIGNAWNISATWKWGSLDCSSEKQKTSTALTNADTAARKNLHMLCDEFAKVQAFSEKTFMASTERTTSARAAANSMALSIELSKAHVILNEVASAMIVQNNTQTALSEFVKVRGCGYSTQPPPTIDSSMHSTNKTDSSVRSTSAVMLLITTMMAF